MLATITVESLEQKKSTKGVDWIALTHDGGEKAACWDKKLFDLLHIGGSIEVDIETNDKGFTNIKKPDVAEKQIAANPLGPATKSYGDPGNAFPGKRYVEEEPASPETKTYKNDDCRQELIVRQSSLAQANATLSRLWSAGKGPAGPVVDQDEGDRTIQLAEMYYQWVMKK